MNTLSLNVSPGLSFINATDSGSSISLAERVASCLKNVAGPILSPFIFTVRNCPEVGSKLGSCSNAFAV